MKSMLIFFALIIVIMVVAMGSFILAPEGNEPPVFVHSAQTAVNGPFPDAPTPEVFILLKPAPASCQITDLGIVSI